MKQVLAQLFSEIFKDSVISTWMQKMFRPLKFPQNALFQALNFLKINVANHILQSFRRMFGEICPKFDKVYQKGKLYGSEVRTV